MKVLCTSQLYDLEGEVADDADLDGCFDLICADSGETLNVRGWLFEVERTDASVA